METNLRNLPQAKSQAQQYQEVQKTVFDIQNQIISGDDIIDHWGSQVTALSSDSEKSKSNSPSDRDPNTTSKPEKSFLQKVQDAQSQKFNILSKSPLDQNYLKYDQLQGIQMRIDYQELISFRMGVFALVLAKKLESDIGLYITADNYLRVIIPKKSQILQWWIHGMLEDIVNSEDLYRTLQLVIP